MARTLKKLGRLLWSAVNGYQKHNVTRLAASIAFYGILSLAPLAVILVTVGGFFFGQKAVEGLIVDPLKNAVGQDAARAVQSMIASAYRSHGSIPATVLAVIVLVFSGSRLIGDIRNSLNTIWEVMGRAGDGFRGFLVGKLVDLAMIFGLAVLVLATLLANTAVSAITRYFARSIPFPTLFLQLSSVILSLVVITAVLTAIFRGLPNVRLGWRDVALGAGLSAVFFEIGNYVIGLYLGRSSLASVFGAAGLRGTHDLDVLLVDHRSLRGRADSRLHAGAGGGSETGNSRIAESVAAATVKTPGCRPPAAAAMGLDLVDDCRLCCGISLWAAPALPPTGLEIRLQAWTLALERLLKLSFGHLGSAMDAVVLGVFMYLLVRATFGRTV